jgi:hypothetical protein
MKDMIGHSDPAMTDRFSHLCMAGNLQRQEKLAVFYAGQGAPFKLSGEHTGNTKRKRHDRNKKEQAGMFS